MLFPGIGLPGSGFGYAPGLGFGGPGSGFGFYPGIGFGRPGIPYIRPFPYPYRPFYPTHFPYPPRHRFPRPY